MIPTGRAATAGVAGRARHLAASVPPTGLVLLAVGSTQLGSAIAKNLFREIGPGGAVFLRVAFAALVLALLWRPAVRGHTRREYALAVCFGLALGGMNLAFYSALDRIPLGVAVTLEFAGPLGVAVAGSRRPLDLAWAALAAGGILLLAPVPGAGLDGPGVLLALLAGACWAAYILLSARVGRAFPGGTGLALAMGVATAALLPAGVAGGGAALLDPAVLLAGFGLALLSSAIPYSLELEALRQLPARVFGVLMSLEPAIAAFFGFVILRQQLGPRALAAIALVTLASVGASRFSGPGPREAA